MGGTSTGVSTCWLNSETEMTKFSSLVALEIIAMTTPVPEGIMSHYSDVIMSAMTSRITDVLIACSTVCSGTEQRIHQTSASLVFVRGNPPVTPHKWSVTWKMFPPDDVIMLILCSSRIDENQGERRMRYKGSKNLKRRWTMGVVPYMMDDSFSEFVIWINNLTFWAPSPYKDRLIYVWWFPC